MPDHLTCFSICSANYMPLARTLHASLVEADPSVSFTLFLADRLPEGCDVSELPFEVVEAEALRIPCFADITYRYTIMELNTAIKPFCFQWLLRRQPDSPVVYLDPDIMVMGPLDALRASFANGSELVLTPHALAPLDDGYDPDDRRIMQTGAYNLGFAALRSSGETETLLEWWAGHMRTRCVSDLPGGLFVDQKFMDMAPAFVMHADVLRHRGYNVAYWNLHERPVVKGDHGWTAGGDPLAFFHFSGVDRKNPEVFSRHQNRYTADGIGDAVLLLEAYKAALAAHDDEVWARSPYAFGQHTDGTPIVEAMRKCYRRVHPAPSASARDQIFQLNTELFNAPSEDLADNEDGAITRLMHEVWRGRLDLRHAFNLRRAEGRRAYADWFAKEAEEQADLPPVLIPNHQPRSASGGENTPQRSIDRQLSNSVRMVGYFRTESGLGEGVRLKHEALVEAGVKVSRHTIRAPGFSNLHASNDEESCGDDALFLFLHINADQTLQTLAELPGKATRGRYRIGYWAWELPRFPEAWRSAIDAVDEIWVPSAFVAEAIRQSTDKPVTVIPHPVKPLRGDAQAGRAALGIAADQRVITTVFDTRSYLRRKNAGGALHAFRDAFPDPERNGVRLVLKSHGPVDDPLSRKLFVDAARTPGVIVRHGVFDASAMGDLLAATDILFSPHRSEGFGLNIAQAMAAGKVAVATGWSGNCAFMDTDNSFLLPFSLQSLAPGDYPFAEGQRWAEPDHDAAVETLRKLAADEALRARIGANGARRMREAFSCARIGKLAGARLSEVYDELHG